MPSETTTTENPAPGAGAEIVTVQFAMHHAVYRVIRPNAAPGFWLSTMTHPGAPQPHEVIDEYLGGVAALGRPGYRRAYAVEWTPVVTARSGRRAQTVRAVRTGSEVTIPASAATSELVLPATDPLVVDYMAACADASLPTRSAMAATIVAERAARGPRPIAGNLRRPVEAAAKLRDLKTLARLRLRMRGAR